MQKEAEAYKQTGNLEKVNPLGINLKKLKIDGID
jgi:hypothetical protein